MRRNKKSGIHKERIIMLASSAFVLAALTMTGVYMKGQNVESKDDGYTLDFTALENNADDKMQEISEYNEEHLLKEEENIPELTANNTAGNEIAAAPVTEDDLDYLPQEVGSGHVEIPGLTDQETLQEAAEAEQQMPELTVEKTLHFTESDGMQKPVQSDILMHYSDGRTCRGRVYPAGRTCGSRVYPAGRICGGRIYPAGKRSGYEYAGYGRVRDTGRRGIERSRYDDRRIIRNS